MNILRNSVGFAVIEVIYQNRDRKFLYADTPAELAQKLDHLKKNIYVVGVKTFRLDQTMTRETNWVQHNDFRDPVRTVGDSMHNMRTIRKGVADAVQG